MIPKALALQAPEQVSLRVNPVMRLFGLLFRPMVHALNIIALGLLRLLRIPEPDQRMALYTSAELEIVTDEAAQSGQLGAMQREVMHNIFDLDKRLAEELMTPRADLEVIALTTTSDEIAGLIEQSPRSRYPVVDGDLDHIVGVLHVKDFILAAQQPEPPRLAELLRHLPTVAATASAERLLERFKREQSHAILVVDEHGGTIGLVTLDDLIAEVMDDDQLADGHGEVTRHPDGSLTVGGNVTLAELRDDHGISITHADVTTIAGVVLAEHGTVPPPGATVNIDGHELEVDGVAGRRITSVRIRPA
jgi:CBS domain containing-hemolysin-like protein